MFQSPQVEPEISLLLHVCDSCRQYLVDIQISKAETSLRSEEEEKIEGFVTKLIAVDKIICGLEEKIVSQLTKVIALVTNYQCPKILNIFLAYILLFIQLCLKIFSGMANSADTDQTAPSGAV